jgi:cytochrome bd-type quinol oxidase subunit 2
MDEQQKLMNWILKLTVSVLATVIGVVVVVMMIGLFVPNDQIDNNKIFEMITPAFNTIVGAFVGLLGGLSINNRMTKSSTETTDKDTEN